MDMEFTFGATVVNTTANLKTTICRDTESIDTMMEYATMDNTDVTKRMAMVFMCGQTVEDILDGGGAENSMVLEHT